MSECEDDYRQKAGKPGERERVYLCFVDHMLSGGSAQESVSPEDGSTRRGLEIEIGR
jgi:hypothetical protein